LSLTHWKSVFEKWNLLHYQNDDASHDIYHFRRVANNAFHIASHYPQDVVDRYVLLAGAYFHDVVNVPKDHPKRKQASKFSAEKAAKILREMGFDQAKIPGIEHAILTHSFSAKIEPRTLEAKILQDADRIDSFGTVGILRTLYVAGRLGRSLFHTEDPLAKDRPLDEQRYSLDYLQSKTMVMPKGLKTEAGQIIAGPRVEIVKTFRDLIANEIVSGKHHVLIELADTFFNAGKEKKFLFHPEDPFASSRKVNKVLYAMDHLLPIGDLEWLFSSLKEELHQH